MTRRLDTLRHARLQELLHYNPETGVFRWKIATSRRVKAGQVAGSVHGGVRRIKVDGRLYLAHRLAWFYVEGRWPIGEIDHQDTNTGNNRFSNLREATSNQNKMNRRCRADSKSGLKGVYARGEKYRARIKIDGKTRMLGTFHSAEDAALAYDLAARLHHGEFARVNFDD